nr:26S proteasome non-ATPase regulatory subunit 13 [Arenicola marina]
MAKDVPSYLGEQQKKTTGDVAQEFETFEELYNKKLWHQLTLRLLEFVKHPSFSQGDGLIKLYNNFISDFEHRINPLALVEMCVFVVRQFKEIKDALDFLDSIKEKVKACEEAAVLALIIKGNIQLKEREMDATKEIVGEAQTILDNLDGVTPVHGRFYELSSSYHKLMGNHAEYYREALRYLGCTTLDDIPSGEQLDRAFNLGLAALLGKGVYNFGELLAHPILNKLWETEKQWLVDLLYAFNSGNIGKFEELKSKWSTQPDLKQHELLMRQKISLLCLMEMTFKRPATKRQLSFDEISKEAHLPVNEVELLVMKALSLGLVKGSIDQVEKKVHMTWVQPRVLDREQIGVMQQKLEGWCTEVKDMESLVQVRAQDILT